MRRWPRPCREVAISRGHDSHVHASALVLPDARELPARWRAQELDLHAGRHLADLVKKQRSATGRLEQAGAVLGCPGERTPRVSEELALQQRLGDCSAVDRDERSAARVDSSWTSRAIRSLPAPLSPVMRTVESTWAMRRARSTNLAHRGALAQRCRAAASTSRATAVSARRCARSFRSAAFSVVSSRDVSDTSRHSSRRVPFEKLSSSARSWPHCSRGIAHEVAGRISLAAPQRSSST